MITKSQFRFISEMSDKLPTRQCTPSPHIHLRSYLLKCIEPSATVASMLYFLPCAHSPRKKLPGKKIQQIVFFCNERIDVWMSMRELCAFQLGRTDSACVFCAWLHHDESNINANHVRTLHCSMTIEHNNSFLRGTVLSSCVIRCPV
jgi:hypothetical protein